jgi:hypothetical protein
MSYDQNRASIFMGVDGEERKIHVWGGLGFFRP